MERIIAITDYVYCGLGVTGLDVNYRMPIQIEDEVLTVENLFYPAIEKL
jgi:hypothetical protein